MPGAFHGIDTVSRALRTFQRALDVTGNNIANVNTRGYSRQTIDLAETEPMNLYSGARLSLGTGVTVKNLNRIRDGFLDHRMQDTQSSLGRFSQLARELAGIESILHEPSADGISAGISKFFDSWSALASNPGDGASKLNVQQAGAMLTQRVRKAYAEIEGRQSLLDAAVKETINRINELGSQIAELNGKIREETALGGRPNSLLDARDMALEELSGLINVTTETFDDGTVAVYLSNFTLVTSDGYRTYPNSYNATNRTVTDGTNNYLVRSGKLAGLFDSIVAADQQQSNLDVLANTFRTQVNALHRTGINGLGNTNVDFFNDALPQTGAIDFDLSAEVKADSAAIASGVSGNAGDGGLALSLSNLRSQQLAALGSQTFSEFYDAAATRLGQEIQFAEGNMSTYETIATQIENQRQSVSGVALDDEMANMLRFQRSYQAAAKVLTVLDQVTEELIGILRR